MAIKRFSSRINRLDKEFLAESLKGASKYLRIAGYFRSSIFELVGEEIAQIKEVKIVCNSEIDFQDFQIASLRNVSLKQHWNKINVAAEALLKKERYQILDKLLKSNNVEIRVVPKDRLFLHGKAGSIHYPNGSRKSFIGSVNETKSAFSSNYELVWTDDDEESADWVETEFLALWNEGVSLPDTILTEIHRVANRQEIRLEDLKPEEIPAAAMAESPIYRGGEQLQPWQRSFVAIFLEHRKFYGKARLLLADEVGVGKTLSMATSALICTLLDDGNVLILAPSTLTIQWQIEMIDKLGVPSAVWSSQEKAWMGVDGKTLTSRGNEDSIKTCPYRIAIISTGLINHHRDKSGFIKAAALLLKNRYGTVILDEAHKARSKGGIGAQKSEPNNLLAFMLLIAKKTRHLILGTATPIQTNVKDIWDLLTILNTNANFVLGDAYSPWKNHEEAIPLITGKKLVQSEESVWNWISNPLPPADENHIFKEIRDSLGIDDKTFFSSVDFKNLNYHIREIWLSQCLEDRFFMDNNPIIRHTVLRKRKQLEDDGLLEKVEVHTHPVRQDFDQYQSRFVGLGIPTNAPFKLAYEKAEEFCKLLQARTKSAGFMKSLMLKRICSSFISGLKTAETMLNHKMPNDNEEMFQEEDGPSILSEMTSGEVACLNEIIFQLSRPEAIDSKLKTVQWFLTEFRTENKTWLEHGCIIFSQYYDTVKWMAEELSKDLTQFPQGKVIAVYAGSNKSGLFREGSFGSVPREVIKEEVRNRNIHLVVATDAACEGLNLQTLGTLINIDMPWNPARLEQRLGRIKRFGQSRKCVDMLNLVYNETLDEKVYNVLSERFQDTYDILGNLPDTIDADWINDEEKLKDHVDKYMNERVKAQDAFTLKYRKTSDPKANLWEKCATVLSRHDIVSKLSERWSKPLTNNTNADQDL